MNLTNHLFIVEKDYLTVQRNQTVSEVIQLLQNHQDEIKSDAYIYVVDKMHHLEGVISLKDILIIHEAQNTHHTIVESIMTSAVVSVLYEEKTEDIVPLFKKYKYNCLPVVDQKNTLLGIICLDDLLTINEAETTEDFQKIAPVHSFTENIRDASISFLFRKRISWLLILVFMNVFSGAGIAYFEETIANHLALVFFLPLLVDSGGNAGSQAATLIIRSLATGDVKLRDWVHLFQKEMVISLALGMTMGLAVSLLGIWRGGLDVAIVVSLSMITIVFIGSLIGMSLPFFFHKLKLDPATASAPLITSLADIIGVFIYFRIATSFLTMS